MKTVKKQLDTVDKLSAIVFAPKKIDSDYYTRVIEILDFIDSYFCINICPQDAGGLTLNELKEILLKKISAYNHFICVSTKPEDTFQQ